MSYRTFTSPDGSIWKAWSVAPNLPDSWNDRAAQFLPAGMAEGWLCLESGEDRRRVSPAPANWAEATDAELWELVGTAVPVTKRGTGT